MKIVILSIAIAALLGAASPSTSTGVSVSPSPTEAGKSVAREFLPGQTYRDCPDCPKIVVVPTGSFTMGSPANEPGRNGTEGPQRKVNIRQFAVGTFDVTRGEWAAFVSATNRSTVGGVPGPGPPMENWILRFPGASLVFLKTTNIPWFA